MAKHQKSSRRTTSRKRALQNECEFVVSYDKSTKRCKVSNNKIPVVEQEEVERVNINLAESRVSMVTTTGMLMTYDLESGNQIARSKYVGNNLMEC